MVVNQLNNKTTSLSDMQSRLLLSLGEAIGQIFSFDQALQQFKVPRTYLRKLLAELVKKGWLKRLKRGLYLIVPIEAGISRNFTESSFVIAKHLIADGTISHWSALNYHGLTEQIPGEIFISTTSQKSSIKIMDVFYRFITIPQRFAFGRSQVWIGNSKVTMHDLERAIIDSLWMSEHCGGMTEVVRMLNKEAFEKIDWNRITTYLQRANKRVLFKRIGFVVSHRNWKVEQVDLWRSYIDKNYSLLDPQGSEGGIIDSTWRLKVNVPIDSL